MINNFSTWKKSRSDFANHLGLIALTVSFFPWTSFNLNQLDSQPWYFIFGFIYLISSQKIKFPGFCFILFCFLMLFGLLIAIIFSNSVLSPSVLRGCFHYVNLVLLCVVFYNLLNRSGFPLGAIFIINLLWIIFGVLELYFPNITSFFSNTRTSIDRGVTSFAPEPYYFGVTLVFFNLILTFYYFFIGTAEEAKRSRYYINLLILFNMFGCIFLSQSLSAVILMGFQILLHISLFFLGAAKLYFLLLMILFNVCVGSILVILFDVFLSGRLVELISSVWESGIHLMIVNDGSANQRIESVIMPFVLFVEHFPFAGGFDNFYSDKTHQLVHFSFLWYPTVNNTILSWLGALFYELGLLGALGFIVFLAMQTRLSLADIYFSFTLVIILISALPISFPPLAFLVAARIWAKSNV